MEAVMRVTFCACCLRTVTGLFTIVHFFAVYLTNLPCFMSEPLKHEMKVCNESLTRGTEELAYKAHSDTANMQETEHKTCRYRRGGDASSIHSRWLM